MFHTAMIRLKKVRVFVVKRILFPKAVLYFPSIFILQKYTLNLLQQVKTTNSYSMQLSFLLQNRCRGCGGNMKVWQNNSVGWKLCQLTLCLKHKPSAILTTHKVWDTDSCPGVHDSRNDLINNQSTNTPKQQHFTCRVRAFRYFTDGNKDLFF